MKHGGPSLAAVEILGAGLDLVIEEQRGLPCLWLAFDASPNPSRRCRSGSRCMMTLRITARSDVPRAHVEKNRVHQRSPACPLAWRPRRSTGPCWSPAVRIPYSVD